MGPIRIRSLLLAAAVISNCITWTASRHHYTHNVGGHRSRHRRQGAGLFLSASYVLPGGEGSGPWGDWQEPSPCSRTCGGGVSSQKRICLVTGSDGRPTCTGGDTKYFSCETQDCPDGSMDFRAEQCAHYDHQLFKGLRYSWVPYTKGPNPCQLNCMPKSARFYYRHAEKVVDGTRCNDESFDVCVDGICQPVGCDMMLGSNARRDKCLECRGNNTNCRDYQGSIPPTAELIQGYNDILLIPAGATSINIREVANSNNYLALRSKTDNKYYLNGDYHIDFPRTLPIAGALWHYERSQQGFAAPDKLRCQGPTNEPLYLSLLLQDENVGIEYEYSLPTSVAPPPNQQYNWVHDEFTSCSATCGGGTQTRNVTCRSREELETVDDTLCDEDLKPPVTRTCNAVPCPPEWSEGPWGACSKPCGEGGTRNRTVYCQKIFTNGFPSVVADQECFDRLGDKPAVFQECNANASCPKWYTGPWKACDALCGEGNQTREVVCYEKDEKGRIEVLSDESCQEEKPSMTQPCELHPCEGVDWVTSDWTGCDSCTSKIRTRIAVCSTKNNVVSDVFCSEHKKPVLEENCDVNKLPACDVQWYATQWSNCSVECGKGVKTRKVFCGLFDGSSVMKVEDSRCNAEEKYNDTKPCETPMDQCPAKWYVGPWEECSEECYQGGEKPTQYRHPVCIANNKSMFTACKGDLMPPIARDCNLKPCNEDDLLPVNVSSTPMMDQDGEEYCEEEDEVTEEIGAEEASTSFTSETMFSDSPSTVEGSGFTTTSELESEFTEGSGSEPSTLSTIESSGSEPTETTGLFDGSSITTESSATDDMSGKTTGSSLTEETGSTIESSGSTESASGATDTSASGGSTESSGTTESSATESSTSGLTNTGSSDVTTESSGTGSTGTGSTGTGSTGTGSTGTGSTEIESTGSTETGSTGTGSIETGSTGSGSTELESTGTGSTESGSTGSTETGSTETGSTGTGLTGTETTGTGSTETGSTGTETTGTGSTETGSTGTETTETGSTETGSTGTETTETGSTETGSTETGSTETGSTETGSTETGSTETGSTETGSTETGSTATESTETGSTETGSTATEDTIKTGSTETGSTETGSTGTGSTGTGSTATGSTETGSTVAGSSETGSVGTAETGSTGTGSTETGSTGTGSTEAGSTGTGSTGTGSTGTGSTETVSTGTGSTVAGSGETGSTGTGSTETGSNGTGSTETGSTETGSAETGSTQTGSTGTGSTGTGSTETGSTGTGSTETGSTVTGSTETGSTGSGGTTESGTTETGGSSESEATGSESTASGVTTESGGTESTLEGSSTTETSRGSTEGTTEWSWTSTVVEYSTKAGKTCKRRKKSPCKDTPFGCCPDKITPAGGPFEINCTIAKTCKETPYGCCPDGVSPATGSNHKGCPIPSCKETLFGCCTSDNKTPAKGNDQEGCPPPPPPCKSSKYGCCEDNETEATGPNKKGCPETETKKPLEGCQGSKYGCCADNETEATGPKEQGCPCNITEYGCCPDEVSPALGPEMEGCVMSCNTSAYGCCPDGETPAHGPEDEGCCLTQPFGCCPDNYKPAEGPHWEGCGCQFAHFGCCPDNVTVARGSNNEGCGCQYSQFGCCPDRHTEASGPEYEGCGCHTYQFGCCPDGSTIAKGPSLQGCHCQQSTFGCCGDGQTAATGPDQAGCDCSTSKYGCCPDGQTEAKGAKFLGCTDAPENKQAACAVAHERGPCQNYTVKFYYDTEYGGCSRFWYGGCEGNGNRFDSLEECNDVCVLPAPKDACKLPQVKGACTGYHLKWYYDSVREQCGQFVYGGCLGNANNFESRELCQEQCEPARSEDMCKLPIEQGSCAGNFGRWGFNAESRRCEQFIWGGCEGNANRFSSEAACVMQCDAPGVLKPECLEKPQEEGNCTEKVAVWSFSRVENRCVPFYYSGCGGNGNRFESEETCAKTCPSSYVQDLCTLPAVTGECAEYREKWYFDTAAKRCRQFYYGGCGGNGNNFATERECETRCKDETRVTTTPTPATPVTEPVSDICRLPMEKGPCSGSELKWAFDAARGACAQFEYGGCAGNRNNFPSLEYCEYYCKPQQDICQMPMVTGPCEESLMRYFYDPTSDSCSQFSYGGCGGNGNNFEFKPECEQRCRSSQPAPITTTPTPPPAEPVQIPRECFIAPSLEDCSDDAAPGEVWYYDPAQRACAVHSNEAEGPYCRVTGAFGSEEACLRSCHSFQGLDVCSFDVEPGPCRDTVAKYYFNKDSRKCELFTYGGCHGGPNRFSTLEECEQICRSEVETSADPCQQQSDEGSCREYHIKWYFDAQRDSCQRFVYTGCGGNDNRFETEPECQAKCKRQPPQPVSSTTTTEAPRPPPRQPTEEECRTPASLVPCGENINVFYYDEAAGRCLAAGIGRCGFSNSYRSEEECERRCGAFRGQDPCNTPLNPGPCRGAFPKIYWDAVEARCQPFMYGGCEGGPNRFSSVEDCEELCGAASPDPACLQAVDTGDYPCTEVAVRRYFFSQQHGDCFPFVYSGCGGNTNNFGSRGECEDLCIPDKRFPESEEQPEEPENSDTEETDTEGPSGEPDTNENEVVPDCSAYEEECRRLVCPYGVQYTRTGAGCQRCACVSIDIDCTPLQQECERLDCPYGMNRTRGPGGCERCRCQDPPNPCEGKDCGGGQRCVVNAYRDPVSQEVKYAPECRTVNKPGTCPAESLVEAPESCRRECNDDADCRGVGKCCDIGCSQLCLEPATPTRPASRPTNTPELSQAPHADVNTQPQVTSNEGGLATLRCLFHGNPPPRITWKRGELTIDGTVGRYRLLSDGALEIVSLYRNDSGVYICVADNGLGVARQEIHLQVDDPTDAPAEISGAPNAVVVGELGHSLNVRCLAYGYPEPAIYWYRGRSGPMVPFSSSLYEARGNVLQIRQLSAETLGEYECQAYNGRGKAATWSVLVEARGSEPQVAVTPRQPRTEPSPATPPPEIDMPVYTVPVSTRLGSSEATVAPGGELSLPCDVDGYPLPDVTWTKDNAPLASTDRITVTDSRLTIHNVEPSDSGVYGCHARNYHSEHSSTVQVTVQGIYVPAKCTDNPFFADCKLIVRSKFCRHKYYSKFCCKSCVEAGQLDPANLELQSDEAWRQKK